MNLTLAHTLTTMHSFWLNLIMQLCLLIHVLNYINVNLSCWNVLKWMKTWSEIKIFLNDIFPSQPVILFFCLFLTSSVLTSQDYCFRLNIKWVQNNGRGCGKMSQNWSFKDSVFSRLVWWFDGQPYSQRHGSACMLQLWWILALKEDKEKAERWCESLSWCNVFELMPRTDSHKDHFAT